MSGETLQDLAVFRRASCAVVADPSDTARREAAASLQRNGCEVTECTHNRALRRLVEQMAPDLVICELRLSDGLASGSVEWMRRDHPEVAVIIVTAHDSIASAVRCAKLGVAAYIVKSDVAPRRAASASASSVRPPTSPHPAPLERAIWEYMHRVVHHAGSLSKAATLLDVDRRSLRRMLSKYAPAA